MKFLKRNILFFFISIFGVILDLLSKHFVFKYFQATITPKSVSITGKIQHPLVVIPSFFNLRVVVNRGAVWGSFHGQTLLLTIFSILAIGFIFYMLWKNQYTKLYQACLGLIMAGAWGNLWDRCFFQGVRDFLDFYIAKYHWPTFNIADVFIVVGVSGFILLEMYRELKAKKDQPQEVSTLDAV